MRLLYLIDELRFRGGTERHLWELAHGMASRGHEVTVLSLDDGPPFDADFRQAPQIRYECLRIKRIYDFSGVTGFLRLASILWRTSPAVVQTFHTASDLIGPLAALLASPRALRVSSRRDLGYTKEARHRRVQAWVNRWVHVVLGNSREVARHAQLSEVIPESKLRVIHNGITVAPFAAIAGRPPNPNPVLGTVANLRHVKGIHVLLEAMRELAGTNPALSLRIAGNGPERRHLASLVASYGIEERVTFLGSVEDVSGFLAGLDLYVQPSLEEGFSNSVLEAMATALPVVATDVGGNKDIIVHGVDGVLVPPDDAPALAAAIAGLAADPVRCEALGAAGQRKVCTSFTIDLMLDKYESLHQAAHMRSSSRPLP